jgi:hypothetical protein
MILFWKEQLHFNSQNPAVYSLEFALLWIFLPRLGGAHDRGAHSLYLLRNLLWIPIAFAKGKGLKGEALIKT